VTDLKRCGWCSNDELYQQYHDQEWGVPVYDDRQLFEMLNLEGAQAGLSWITVLKKREHYRKLKVNAFIVNAQLYLDMQADSSSPNFSEYLWSFVGGKPIVNARKSLSEFMRGLSEIISNSACG